MKKSLLILRRWEPSVGVHHAAACRRRIVIYCECQKNHAASIGGHVVDGCREFIAEGEEGTTGALKCGACGCHRSFHRRVQECEVTCECSSLQLWRQ